MARSALRVVLSASPKRHLDQIINIPADAAPQVVTTAFRGVTSITFKPSANTLGGRRLAGAVASPLQFALSNILVG